MFVRYQSAKNPDGRWAAFTSVPAGPISPTNGHKFINSSVNFGGEHFGVGFYGTPTTIQYPPALRPRRRGVALLKHGCSAP